MITRKTLHWRKPFVTTFYFILSKLSTSFYFLRGVLVIVVQSKVFGICGEALLILKWPYVEIQYFSQKEIKLPFNLSFSILFCGTSTNFGLK